MCPYFFYFYRSLSLFLSFFNSDILGCIQHYLRQFILPNSLLTYPVSISLLLASYLFFLPFSQSISFFLSLNPFLSFFLSIHFFLSLSFHFICPSTTMLLLLLSIVFNNNNSVATSTYISSRLSHFLSRTITLVPTLSLLCVGHLASHSQLRSLILTLSLSQTRISLSALRLDVVRLF